jgi:hypothetical protein
MDSNRQTARPSSKEKITLVALSAAVLISAWSIVLATGFGRIWLGPMAGSLVGLFWAEYIVRQNPERFASKSILRYKSRREKTLFFIEMALWLIVFCGLIEIGLPVAAFGVLIISIVVSIVRWLNTKLQQNS